MMTTINSSDMTRFEAGGITPASPQDALSTPEKRNADADHNPLRRLVDWFLQGNAADRKAARDLEDMVERLSKLPPYLLDDIGIIAEPRRAKHFDALIMPSETLLSGSGDTAKPAVTPVSFYLSDRFATK